MLLNANFSTPYDALSNPDAFEQQLRARYPLLTFLHEGPEVTIPVFRKLLSQDTNSKGVCLIAQMLSDPSFIKAIVEGDTSGRTWETLECLLPPGRLMAALTPEDNFRAFCATPTYVAYVFKFLMKRPIATREAIINNNKLERFISEKFNQHRRCALRYTPPSPYDMRAHLSVCQT